MKKSIGVILCICLLTGLVSGCGAEENHLTENSNAAAFEESSEPKTDDMAVSGNDQTPVMEESAGEIEPPMEEANWQQAYLAKAEEIETEHGFPMEYDLIYLDGDDIPELVAGPTGYWFILYTWKDGEVYELIDYAPYGLHGRMYCYEPHQGIIEESVYDMITEGKESDSYTIFYTIYHTVTEDMEIVEEYELSEEYRETGSTYFYQDASWTESREIDEEEFSSYKKESLPEIYGRLDLEALRFLLGNTDDSSAFFSDFGNMEDEAVSSLLVTETYYDMDYPITYQYQTEYEYDSAGNQIRVLSYHEDGTYSEYEFKYKYDDTGNLIEMASCKDGVMTHCEKYEYDEDGRIKSQVYIGERSQKVSVYQYDYYGNMTMEVTYSFYGEIFNKNCFLYEYDKDGNLIKETDYRYDIFVGINEYMYDDSDNLIREVFYDTEGDSIWFRGYEYDKNGNIIEETTLSHINKYEYDQQNNKTREISYLLDGSMRYYSEFTYEWQ